MSQQRKSSPWKLGGFSKKELARRTWKAINNDDMWGPAAQIAYYFFFAIFPLAIFLICIMGLIVGGSAAQYQVTEALVRGVPSDAREIVRQTVQHAIQASGGGKLGFGFIIALYSASAGMTALIDALGSVNKSPKGRSFLRLRVIATGLTIATGILILIATGLITAGSNLAHQIFGGVLYWVWNIVQYPIAITFLLLSVALIYYWAANVESREWRWITPGAVVGVFLWILVSLGLREYLRYSNNYISTYGLLGAVMVLMLWFYVTGLAILIGGEVNSIIEHGTAATVQDNSEGK